MPDSLVGHCSVPPPVQHFRVEVFSRGAAEFEVRVFDLLDHGPEIPYAVVHNSDLERALAQASHYMLMADNEPSREVIGRG